MSVLKIEAIYPRSLEEAVAEKWLAKKVCEKCPLLRDCEPHYSLTEEEISHLESLLNMFSLSDKTKHLVQVYGYRAGESGCLLTKKDSPIEFKQVPLFEK